MLCSSPATGTVLNSSGSNTSHAQPINHQRAQRTNHLLMKHGSHEFLTAIVLFIKPDQTMRIQTSFKKRGEENNLFSGRQQTVIDEKTWCTWDRERETSSEWCFDSRMHVWINTPTKGNFLPAARVYLPLGARWAISGTVRKRKGLMHFSPVLATVSWLRWEAAWGYFTDLSLPLVHTSGNGVC